jgi:hypothetical protein
MSNTAGTTELEKAREMRAQMDDLAEAGELLAKEGQELYNRDGDLYDEITTIDQRKAVLVTESKEINRRLDLLRICQRALEFVVPPARREIATTLVLLQRSLLDHANSWPAPVEQCEHQMRERRSYAEIQGTEGYDIITSVGLKPFPELTERQQAVVAQRKREAEDFRQQLVLAGTVPSQGSVSIGGSV